MLVVNGTLNVKKPDTVVDITSNFHLALYDTRILGNVYNTFLYSVEQAKDTIFYINIR